MEVFYFIIKIATENSFLKKGLSLSMFVSSHAEVHIWEISGDSQTFDCRRGKDCYVCPLYL